MENNFFKAIQDNYGPMTATSYDDIANSFFWAYKASLEAVVMEIIYARKSLAIKNKKNIQILDLGMGTGNLSFELLKQIRKVAIELKEITVYGLDTSEHMMQVAEKKLSAFSDVNFKSIISNMQSLDKYIENDTFDLIISSFAIHHLDEKAKKQLFSLLNKKLKPKGLFVFADRMNIERIEKAPKNFGYMNVAAAKFQEIYGKDKPKLEDTIKDITVQFEDDGDQPSTLEEQLKWMTDSEFKDVRSPFHSFGCAVLSGTK